MPVIKKIVFIQDDEKVTSIKGDSPVKSIKDGKLNYANESAGEVEYHACCRRHGSFAVRTYHKWTPAKILPSKIIKTELNFVVTESLKESLLLEKINSAIKDIINDAENPGIMGAQLTVKSEKQEPVKPIAIIKPAERLLQLKQGNEEQRDSTVRFSKLEID